MSSNSLAGAASDLRTVDDATVDQLRRLLPNQSKESVMDTLGISSNTWTKMKRGEPVRSWLVDRAISRLHA